MKAAAVVRVAVCGELQLAVGDVVFPDALPRWHARALLALLAGAAGCVLPRDVVCDVLWPERPAAAARNRLYHTVLLLKRALSAVADDCEWITVREGVVALHPQLRSDAQVVRALAEHVDPVRSLQWLVTLVRPLPPYALWLPDAPAVRQIRSELEFAWLQALRNAVVAAQTRGDTVAVRRASEFLLQAAPGDEPAHRTLMALDLRAGLVHQVLRRYEDCTRVVSELHGLRPSATTTALAVEAAQQLTITAAALPRAAYLALTTLLPLIGREAQVRRVQQLLLADDASVVTLHGAGGIGKTRLATEVAAQLRTSFGGDVVWVNLMSAANDTELLARVVDALGTASDPGVSGVPVLRQLLIMRRLLLVLDNVDHHLCNADWLPDGIDCTCASRVLVTSRRPLGVAGEQSVLLDPLDVPATASAPQTALDSAAVQLFLLRAPLGSIEISDSVLADIGRLVTMLDGNPLAIEIAAARMDVNTPAELMRLLDHTLEALDQGPPDLEPRHRSISAMLELTARQLSATARSLYVAASAFAASFGIEDLHALAYDDIAPRADLVAARDELLAARLLVSARTEADSWRMPALARRYAQALAREAGVEVRLTRRHIARIDQCVSQLVSRRWYRDQAGVADQLDEWRGDISLALQRALALDRRALVSLVVHLGDYWLLRSETVFGLHWSEQALVALTQLEAGFSADLACRLHVCRARLLLARVNVEPARQSAVAALELAEVTGRSDLIADAVECLATATLCSGAVSESAQLAEHWLVRLDDTTMPEFWRLLARHSVAIARIGGQSPPARSVEEYARFRDEFAGTHTWLHVALAEWARLFSCGEWATAYAVALQSVDVASQLRAPHLVAAASTRQALAEYALDDLDAALTSARRARALAEQAGLMALAAAAAGMEVDVLIRSGRAAECVHLLESVAPVLRAKEHGALRSMWFVLSACLAIERGDVTEAGRLLIDLVADERLLLDLGTLLAVAELALVLALARSASSAAELRWLIQQLDALRVSPRKPAEWRWLARHDPLATPLPAPLPGQPPAAQLVAQLKRACRGFGLRLAVELHRLPQAPASPYRHH